MSDVWPLAGIQRRQPRGAARGTSNPIDEIAPTSVVKIGAGYKARLAKKQAKLAETLDQATIVLDLVADN